MSTQYGVFRDFCRDTGSLHSTLPVCNLFSQSPTRGGNGYNYDGQGCDLIGITLSGDRYLANLGSIILAFIAILVSLFLLYRSDRKKAAVGRR